MFGALPPSSPTVDTVQRQQNQLLGQPGVAGSAGPKPTGGSMFPQINSALSQSPLLQQSNSQIQQMVAALMQQGRRM